MNNLLTLVGGGREPRRTPASGIKLSIISINCTNSGRFALNSAVFNLLISPCGQSKLSNNSRHKLRRVTKGGRTAEEWVMGLCRLWLWYFVTTLIRQNKLGENTYETCLSSFNFVCVFLRRTSPTKLQSKVKLNILDKVANFPPVCAPDWFEPNAPSCSSALCPFLSLVRASRFSLPAPFTLNTQYSTPPPSSAGTSVLSILRRDAPSLSALSQHVRFVNPFLLFQCLRSSSCSTPLRIPPFLRWTTDNR